MRYAADTFDFDLLSVSVCDDGTWRGGGVSLSGRNTADIKTDLSRICRGGYAGGVDLESAHACH